MAALNRTTLFTRLFKALKKHYEAPQPPPARPLLEQLLFACCLENASFEKAQQAYQALVDSYFDWNEVRVSTVRELAESMHMLPDPPTAANHVKRLLQAVFESTYSFDLEAWRKLTVGEAQKKLREINGVTPFAVAVATQAVLGGHAIGVDRTTWDLFSLLGLAGERERAAGTVPGLERAIPKNKGQEFFALLHECAAELLHESATPRLLKVVTDVVPDAKTRLEQYFESRRAAAAGAEHPSEPASVTDQHAPAAPTPVTQPRHAPATQAAVSAPASSPRDESKPAAKARPAKTESPPAPAARSEPEKPAAEKAAAEKTTAEKPAAKTEVQKTAQAKRATKAAEGGERKPARKQASPTTPRADAAAPRQPKAAKKKPAPSSPAKRKPR
jgi:endonuclease-3